jgi:hypothetical protein
MPAGAQALPKCVSVRCDWQRVLHPLHAVAEMNGGKELEACLADFGLSTLLPVPDSKNSANL